MLRASAGGASARCHQRLDRSALGRNRSQRSLVRKGEGRPAGRHSPGKQPSIVRAVPAAGELRMGDRLRLSVPWGTGTLPCVRKGRGKWSYAPLERPTNCQVEVMKRKNKKKSLVNKISVLLTYAKRLYAATDGPQARGNYPLAYMMVFITGRAMTKHECWMWLDLNYEPNRTDLPAVTPKPRGSGRRRVPPKSHDDGFYSTKEWRAIRFQALKESNGSCALCGRSQRMHGVVLHVDHIKPRSLFPSLRLTLSNLQVLCEDCNLGKSNRDQTDWRVIDGGKVS